MSAVDSKVCPARVQEQPEGRGRIEDAVQRMITAAVGEPSEVRRRLMRDLAQELDTLRVDTDPETKLAVVQMHHKQYGYIVVQQDPH